MRTPSVLFRSGVTAAIVGIFLAGCSKPVPTAATTPTPIPASSAASETVDGDVTSNVKTALLRETGFKGADIAVVTLKGDVRLTGMLDNQAQIDSAIKIARATEGVHSIHDELTIRK